MLQLKVTLTGTAFIETDTALYNAWRRKRRRTQRYGPPAVHLLPESASSSGITAQDESSSRASRSKCEQVPDQRASSERHHQ